MPTTPPRFPWVKGIQPDYRSFILRVGVCQDGDQNVWSYSDLEDDTDRQTTNTLPSHGVEQIAFGLLCEAVRREAYLQVLVRLTQDADFVEKFAKADPAARAAMQKELCGELAKSLHQSVDRMAMDASGEVLTMLSAGAH